MPQQLILKDMRKFVCVCSLVLAWLGTAPDVYALTCPNKPSNATTLATVHFNTNDGEGQLWDLYPGAGTITTVSGSEGSVSASILAPGASVGGQQVIWPKPGNQQPLNNMYSCFRWKMNSQFVGLQTGNKLVFQAAQDWTYGKQGMNGLLVVPPIGYGTQNFQMLFTHNSGNLDNSHACAADLGLACYANISSTTLRPDTWYEVEFYTIASSCTTCRNATVKWWINNVPQGSYTNLNYGDGIVNQWQINHTWDGSTDKQCGPPTNPSNAIGRNCTNPQIHYFDELIIASVGGLPVGGGGAVDNPPGPPGTVTLSGTVQ